MDSLHSRECQNWPRVWALEDDPLYLKALQQGLGSLDVAISGFTCADVMLRTLCEADEPPEMFLVDFHLGTSKHDGLSVCRSLICLYHRPVIILTEDQSVDKTIACLDAGAEDYLRKACGMKELRARIRARLRAVASHGGTVSAVGEPSESAPRVIQHGTLILDTQEQSLRCTLKEHHPVQLTYNESKVLGLMMKAPDKILQRSDAYFALHQRDLPPDNRSIDITISRIRRQLRQLGGYYSIRSLHGKGYRLLPASKQ